MSPCYSGVLWEPGADLPRDDFISSLTNVSMCVSNVHLRLFPFLGRVWVFGDPSIHPSPRFVPYIVAPCIGSALMHHMGSLSTNNTKLSSLGGTHRLTLSKSDIGQYTQIPVKKKRRCICTYCRYSNARSSALAAFGRTPARSPGRAECAHTLFDGTFERTRLLSVNSPQSAAICHRLKKAATSTIPNDNKMKDSLLVN